MASATQQQVLAATRRWLRPAIHVLLRCGVTWREFAELAKTTYVEVATAKFGLRGRPTNVSRTAMLTGLARRDVRKQREALASVADPAGGYVTKASLVLSAWHLNPDFLDSRGRPARLPMNGAEHSFSALVHRCAGTDVPATTLLKELVSSGAVRRRADGKLEAVHRSYIPQTMDEQLIRLWGSVMADVATTYVHNLTRPSGKPSRFERAAVNDRIDARALPEFRALLETEGQVFLEKVDAWLTAHEINEKDAAAGKKIIRLGVGAYHVQDE
jgi:hypothetical protein